MIGWDLILEYAVGSMTVAIGWSGYFQRILAGFGIAAAGVDDRGAGAAPGSLINLPAMIIVLLIMVLLVVGIRESARFNAAMVAIKIVAVLFFLVDGRVVRPAGQLDAVHAVRVVGRHDRGGGRLLRLHRLRRGVDDGGGGQESAAGSADRHHRLARHLHGAVRRRVRGADRHRARRRVPARTRSF